MYKKRNTEQSLCHRGVSHSNSQPVSNYTNQSQRSVNPLSVRILPKRKQQKEKTGNHPNVKWPMLAHSHTSPSRFLFIRCSTDTESGEADVKQDWWRRYSEEPMQ